MRQTSLKVLDSWLDATQAIFFNRYFGTALVSFWFLLYNYLWAVLPTLRLKSVWAFTACLVLGSATTYSISRTPEMAALEETALNKLRRMLAAYLAELRGEAARGASGLVLACCSAVSALAQTTGLLVVLGALSVVNVIYQSVLSLVLTGFEAVQFFCTLLGLGADVVVETAQPLVDVAGKLSAAAHDGAVAASAAAAALYRNRTGLVAMLVGMDWLLPYNVIGHTNKYARAWVAENLAASAVTMGIVQCIVVSAWVPRAATSAMQPAK